jgi:hypothetical protein
MQVQKTAQAPSDCGCKELRNVKNRLCQVRLAQREYDRIATKFLADEAAKGEPILLNGKIKDGIKDCVQEALNTGADAGAQNAGFMLLRLPHELGTLFEQWLHEHYPQRADRVLNLLRDARGGRLNDPRFGHRMRGEGAYAVLLAARFKAACRRLGLNQARGPELDCSRFLRDPAAPRQGELFG